MLKRLLIAACLVLMPCVAVAGPFEDGKAAYDRKDYRKAYDFFLPLAEDDNANSQVMLGIMHDEGHGVTKDPVAALLWYRKAAEQGRGRDDEEQRLIAEAQWNVGSSYEHGHSVPKDYVLAYMWYNLAAATTLPIKSLLAGYRDRLAKLMTKEQIAEAQRMAREWLAMHPQ